MKGIIFTGDHPTLILAGKKTQTRRVMKPQPKIYGDYWEWNPKKYCIISNKVNAVKYARYRVGEIAYIKESWRVDAIYDQLQPNQIMLGTPIQYVADGHKPLRSIIRHAMFMPQWAARAYVRFIGVRAERLHDMTDADAYAEGITEEQATACWHDGPQPVGAYAKLWDSINGKTHPWASNPWVWVYEFEMVGL